MASYLLLLLFFSCVRGDHGMNWIYRNVMERMLVVAAMSSPHGCMSNASDHDHDAQ